MENFHIIHKQVLEVTTDNVRDAHEIESRINELVKQINTPEFEKCFDGLLSPDQHLLIERLEIDLGVFKKSTLFKEVGACLNLALKEALLKNITQNFPSIYSEKTDGQTMVSENFFKEKGKSKSSGSLSRLEGPFEIFLFFLEKGRLPNWVPMAFTLEDDWIETLDTAQQILLRKLILKSKQALLRLATNFSVRFITRLLTHFQPVELIFENWVWLEDHLKSDGFILISLRRQYWVTAIFFIISKRGQDRENATIPYDHYNPFERIIIQKTLSNLPENRILLIRKLLMEKNIPGSIRTGLSNRLEEIIKNKTKKEDNRLKTELPIADQGSDKLSIENFLENMQDPELKAEKMEKIGKDIRNELLSTEDPILVNDAGLVLLCPFISELFQSCDLLDKGFFKSLEMSARAVHILVYLAHGTEELPEYKKLLPKLLCGIAWKTVLPDGLPLTDYEKKQADELLKAVLNHWKALRNSSAEAIQEAFIRRPGKLIPGNQGIILEVERKTQDVLLSRLPWGFSMIKLQWMPHILHVSWI